MKKLTTLLFILIISMSVSNAQKSISLLGRTYQDAPEVFEMLDENDHMVFCTHHGFLFSEEPQYIAITLKEGFTYTIATLTSEEDCIDLDMEIYQIGNGEWVKVYEDTKVDNDAFIKFKCFETQRYAITLIPYEMAEGETIAPYMTIISFPQSELE